MLTLTKLSIGNFGPFKGEQELLFPERGIGIVYGENMRGKTSLLNAIRYALYGKVISRGSRKQALDTLVNWEARDEGNYGFTVELRFSNRGSAYVLTRSYHLKKGVAKPKNGNDYEEDCFLRKDGAMLGPDQRDLELATILPEEVSRFFLFDGELLQEYEELLRDDSVMGPQISKAIERILGVPVLTNSRSDLMELQQKAQQEASKAAQLDQRTAEFGTHLAEQITQRKYRQEEQEKLKAQLKELRGKEQGLKEDLQAFSRVKAWLDDIDQWSQEVEFIESKLADKKSTRQGYMVDVWRDILAPAVRVKEEELDARHNEIQTRLFDRRFLDLLKDALAEDLCSVCLQDITPAARTRIEAEVQRLESNLDGEDEEELESLAASLQVLGRFEEPKRAELVAVLTEDIERLVVERTTKLDQIKEIKEQTRGFDESQVRAKYAEQEKTQGKIALVEKDLAEIEANLEEIGNNIVKLEKSLNEIGSVDSVRERRKSEVYRLLHELFDEGVKRYRDKLRERVEKDASEVFLRLTTEPDYAGLRITDTYGLIIVHKDGQEIPVRSAGAEHVVALSLMAALQNNAPLKGPIIMDSPFGRLDSMHTNKVIQALPSMAEQVLLLVYRSELNQQAAREALKGDLKAEYKMERMTARHTQLAKEL